MMWSKLRKKFKEFITPDLRKRIDVHCTCYHDAHDDYGEAWITLDGKKIFGGGYFHWYVTPVPTELRTEFSINHGFHEDFYNVQIKTKFDKIQLQEYEHPLVIIFYNLRKQCFDKAISK